MFRMAVVVVVSHCLGPSTFDDNRIQRIRPPENMHDSTTMFAVKELKALRAQASSAWHQSGNDCKNLATFSLYSRTNTRMYARMRTRTHAGTHARTHAHTHASNHARALTRARKSAHPHAYPQSRDFRHTFWLLLGRSGTIFGFLRARMRST